MKEIAKEIAKDLLKIKAVELKEENHFTWASGIKSPVYCDNRLTLSYPQIREKIAEKLTEIIKEKFENINLIAGVATAGIPHATLVSYKMNLPLVYVRDKKKNHGKTNQIEGKVIKGQKAVVIEDLISTGMSSINAVKALQQAGIEVAGVVAIYSYNIKKAKENFAENNLKYYTLTGYDTLIEEAIKEKYIDEKAKEKLIEFRDNL